MELDRILLYSADELCRCVAARLKYRSACYSSSKLQWSGGSLRCLNGMDCYLLFPVVSVRLLIVSEHRWLTLLEPFSSYRCLTKWSEQRKNNKNGTFATAHFFVQLSSAWLLATYMSLADHKGTQRGSLGA